MNSFTKTILIGALSFGLLGGLLFYVLDRNGPSDTWPIGIFFGVIGGALLCGATWLVVKAGEVTNRVIDRALDETKRKP